MSSFIKKFLGMNNGKDNKTVDTTQRFQTEKDPHDHEPGKFFEDRVRGKLTRVDPKGFGFITSKDIPFTRIFFHWSGLLQSTRNFQDLEKGMIVEFNPFLIEGKGYRALRIEVVEDNNYVDSSDLD